MTSLRRALIAIGAAGFAAGLIAIAIVASGDHDTDTRTLDLIIGPLVGWAFVGAGLVAWWRRPDNRFGALMTAVGFAWFAAALALSDVPGVFIVGVMVSALPFALLLHMLLAFPTGRLDGRAPRTLIAIGYATVLGVLPIGVLFVDTTEIETCDGCPENPLLITDNDVVGNALWTLYVALSIGCLIATAVILLGRWRRAPGAQRRLLGPLYLAGGATIVLTALLLALGTAGEHPVARVINVVAVIVLATVPFAFLAGLLRSRLAQSVAVTDVVTRGRTDLRQTLAGALKDPSLELAYWLPDRRLYVNREGRPVTLPDDATDAKRSVTRIEHDGRRIAAIVHDAALDQEPGLVRAVGAAAALALENERLEAELRARVDELRASRARIVEAGLTERRRLERDLHDGAQQRLVALRLQLRMARDRAAGDPDATAEMLDGAAEQLDAALEELRELARGIHPAILTDRGLEPAISALAGRAPVPVEITSTPDRRLPARVEAAAYFVVSEALTNVAKYANATHASVAIDRRNGHAVVEVRDDGVGGADPSRGTGLAGLGDRLAALDGRLEIASPEGGGTVVRADIPCEL